MKRSFPAAMTATCVFATAPSASATSLNEPIDKALSFGEARSVQMRGPWEYDVHEEVGALFGAFNLVEAILRCKPLKQ